MRPGMRPFLCAARSVSSLPQEVGLRNDHAVPRLKVIDTKYGSRQASIRTRLRSTNGAPTATTARRAGRGLLVAEFLVLTQRTVSWSDTYRKRPRSFTLADFGVLTSS